AWSAMQTAVSLLRLAIWSRVIVPLAQPVPSLTSRIEWLMHPRVVPRVQEAVSVTGAVPPSTPKPVEAPLAAAHAPEWVVKLLLESNPRQETCAAEPRPVKIGTPEKVRFPVQFGVPRRLLLNVPPAIVGVVRLAEVVIATLPVPEIVYSPSTPALSNR